VIRRNDEVSVIGNVAAAFVFRFEQPLIESALGEINGLISDSFEELRDLNLVFASTSVEPEPGPLATCPVSCLTIDHAQELTHVLNLIKAIRGHQRTAGVFNRSRQLNKHQAVKSKIAEA